MLICNYEKELNWLGFLRDCPDSLFRLANIIYLWDFITGLLHIADYYIDQLDCFRSLVENDFKIAYDFYNTYSLCFSFLFFLCCFEVLLGYCSCLGLVCIVISSGLAILMFFLSVSTSMNEIVNKLQEKNHICGMTGDCVNDPPFLKKAGIGITVVDAPAAQ